MRFLSVGLVVLGGLVGWAPASWAWSSEGHRRVSAAALELVTLAGLEWSSSEKLTIVNASVQPDLMRPRQLSQLRAIEAPRHYLDLEVVEGNELPEERWQYFNLLARIARAAEGHGILRPDGDVSQIGTLPYALVEGAQRLAAIFAQLRNRPHDLDLRSMAAHQAGFVAHYAQDLCQPLHTTVHHDGRARRDGSSPRTGIHRQVDGLFESISLSAPEVENPQTVEALFPAVLEMFQESHSRVDRVYDLADEIADLHASGRADPQLVDFAQERFRQAVGFTADLIHAAWQLSTTVDVPAWARVED